MVARVVIVIVIVARVVSVTRVVVRH